MKKLLTILLAAACILFMAACTNENEATGSSVPESSEGQDQQEAQSLQEEESRDGDSTDQEQMQTFSGAQHVSITGYLQHIEVRPASGDEIVIRWISDGSETVQEADGVVRLSFQEPQWTKREGEPFTVVSTIYLEVPQGLDTISLSSILGDIVIDGTSSYNRLVAQTVDGNVTATGIVGQLQAETGRGEIHPDTFASEITLADYDDAGTQSKSLHTVIPGAANESQNTVLWSESGILSINE